MWTVEKMKARRAELIKEGHSCDDCDCNVRGQCLPNSLLNNEPYKADGDPCTDWGGKGSPRLINFLDITHPEVKTLLRDYTAAN